MIISKLVRPLIDSQFNEKKMGRAGLFFILPFVLLTVLTLLAGGAFDVLAVVLSVLKELAFWLASGLIIFVLLMAFKGSEVHGKFTNIVSAYSVNYIINFVSGALVYLAVFLAIPDFFGKISALQGTEPTMDILISAFTAEPLISGGLVWVLLAALLIIGLVTFFLNLYVIFRIGNLVKKTSTFSNCVFVVVFLGLSFVLNTALAYIFALL